MYQFRHNIFSNKLTWFGFQSCIYKCVYLKVLLAIYLTKNKNTILLIIKSFKLVKTFKKRNKIGLSARITI